MIHLCVESPFADFDTIAIVGKGPSAESLWKDDADEFADCAVGINEAAVEFGCEWLIAVDWTVVRDLNRKWDGRWRPIVSNVAWFRPECAWVREPYVNAMYFDARRVLGQDVESKSVPGRKLGVGTATVALQLAAEAGVKRVLLNGFDNYWGDDTPAYAPVFEEKYGCKVGGYAEEFPASGSPVEQLRLVRESMQYVIDQKGLEVERY